MTEHRFLEPHVQVAVGTDTLSARGIWRRYRLLSTTKHRLDDTIPMKCNICDNFVQLGHFFVAKHEYSLHFMVRFSMNSCEYDQQHSMDH